MDERVDAHLTERIVLTIPTDRRFRGIALDAVGTLIFAEPSVSAAYSDIGARYGSQQSVEQVKARLAGAMRRAGELSVARFGEAHRTVDAGGVDRAFCE